MRRRKSCSWIVCGSFWIECKKDGCLSHSNFLTKPTLKSAVRIAQKLADKNDIDVEIYNVKDNARAHRRGGNATISGFIVTPKGD